MQVYRGMNIGSAKPEPSLLAEIPHHLVDIRTPDYQFNAGEFVRLSDKLIPEILQRGRIPVLAGGTAFYFRNFLFGLPEAPSVSREIREEVLRDMQYSGLEILYRELKDKDPVRADQIHPHDQYRIIRALEVIRSTGKTFSRFNTSHTLRPGITPLILGLTRPREELYDRINRRVDRMFAEGLVSEVKRLIAEGYGSADPGMKGIGYSEFFLQSETGEMTVSTVADLVKRNSRHYAKRQLTFFKKIPGVKWFSPDDTNTVTDLVKVYCNSMKDGV